MKAAHVPRSSSAASCADFANFYVALFVFCAIGFICTVLHVHCVELLRHAGICLRMPSMLDPGGLPSLQRSIVQLLATCGGWNTGRNEGSASSCGFVRVFCFLFYANKFNPAKLVILVSSLFIEELEEKH